MTMTAISMVMVGACAAEQHVDDPVYIKASNTGEGYRFGFSVAFSGDTLAVGSIGESSQGPGIDGNQERGGAFRSGAVYVFRDTGTGWQQEAHVKAFNPGPNDAFGYSVALSGDTLVVGAPGESGRSSGVNGDQSDRSSATEASGAVYVFRRSGAMWEQEAYLKASNNGALAQSSMRFGDSVAISGDTLVVGAPYEDSHATGVNGDQEGMPLTLGDSGAAYVFRRSGTTWAQEAYLKASNTTGPSTLTSGDTFGWSVGIAGDTIAVGAIWESSAARGINGDQSDDSIPGAGAVYVFRRSDTTWQQEAYVKASNAAERDFFGGSLALLDDTLVVGARGRGGSEGAAYVFRRSGDQWQEEAFIASPGVDKSGGFGASVALSNDLIAIGADDESSTLTGAPSDFYDYHATFSGAVYTFRRTDTGWEQEAHLKAPHLRRGDRLGHSVALSGESLAAGALYDDSGATGIGGDPADDSADVSGAVYVFP
jgi:hypothetical protein